MHPRRLVVGAALALTTISIAPVAAHAASSGATYYVQDSGTCSDAGPGTTAAPFCTIADAAAVATSPGDTVLIEPGTYSGEIDITASGTAAAPITFKAATPESTLYLNVRDDTSATTDTYGLHLDGASYIDLSGIGFGGYTGSTHAIDVENSSHVTLDNLSTAENVLLTGNSGQDTVSRVTVSNVDNDYSGASIEVDSSGTGNVITTNVAMPGGNGAAGITVTGSADAAVTSNTIWDYCGAGIAIGDDSNGTASGATIENNVIEDAVTDANDEDSCASATTAGISVQSAADESGLTANYNDVYPADSVNTEVYDWAGDTYQTPAALNAVTGQGAADSIANPEVAGDGVVKDETSPVINAANSDAPGELATDINGHARVYDPNVPETGAGTQGYDRGAWQFTESLTLGQVTVPATAPSGAAITVGAPTAKDNWANATYTYTYDFGDGSTQTTSDTSVTHTYAATGSYTVNVTVTSGFGASTSTDFGISILKPVAFSASFTTTAEYALGVDAQPLVTTDWPITTSTINFGDGTGSVNDLTADYVRHTYTAPGTYTITYTMADEGGDSKSFTNTFTTAGSEFTPIEPTRLLDTRKNQGGTSSQLADDGSIKLKIAGVDNIPSNVTAVDLNLTAVNATGGGYIEANTGTNNGTSNLNYGKSLIYSNSVIARVAADGTVTLRNFAGTTAVKLDLVADVTGYFSLNTADRFKFITTSRIMDTRSGTGGSTGPLGAGKTDVLTVAGAGGVPATGVDAVSVNLTITDTTNDGYLVAYADGAAMPGTSDVNWQGATTKATNVLVPVGADGKIDILNRSGNGGNTQVIVDVTGYFTHATTAADLYVPVTPARVLDTRTTSPIAAGADRLVNLGGADGMPVAQDGDPVVMGYVFNATATSTQQPGWLLLSNGQSGTTTSTVNWTGSGQTAANLAITEDQQNGAIGSDSSYAVDVHNGSLTKPVQAIVDVMGYFCAS